MNLVFIYGPPATGKLTVASDLAKTTGYTLFDNHVTYDLALQKGFDPTTWEFHQFTADLRLGFFEDFIGLDRDVIFTFCYVPNDFDNEMIEQTIDLVEQNMGNAFYAIQLTASRKALLQRVSAPSRNGGKIRDPENLEKALSTFDYFQPIPHRVSLQIDTTNMPPEQAARRIADRYGLTAPAHILRKS